MGWPLVLEGNAASISPDPFIASPTNGAQEPVSMHKRKLRDAVDIEIDEETGLLRPLKKNRGDHMTADGADAASMDTEEETGLSDFNGK